MNKYFLLLAVIGLSFTNEGFSQDIITTQSGEEIKTTLLKVNRQGATYQNYSDPELHTYTIPYKDIATIKEEKEKKPVYFNHKLPRAYVAISAGPSLALGSLSKADFSDASVEPGFAKTGVNYNFDAGFYIRKKIGVAISAGSYENEFDYNKYAKTYGANDSISNLSVGPTTNTDSKGNYANKKWEFKYFLVGPMYSFKLLRRLTWDIKAKVGVVTTKKPSMLFSYYGLEYSTGNPLPASYNLIYHTNSKTDLSYSFGTSFRFDVTNRLALYVGADYIHTSPTINYDIEKMVNMTSTSTNYNAAYNFSSLNVTAGVAFLFKRKGNKFE